MRRRGFVAALLAGAALPGVLAVPVGAQGPPRREVRLGVAGLPSALEPAAALDGAAALVARQVFDTLVAWREGSTDIEPALATRWTASRDGLVWSFTLRDNVRFHDGTALTAADVAASFDRHLRDPSRPSVVWSTLLRGVPGVIREIRATDPRTVQFVLVQPYAPLLTVLAHPGFGVARQVSGPDGVPRLVGTGPFRLVDVSSGRLVVEAVAGHWAGSPLSERIVFLEVPNEEHAEAELGQRGLDVWFPSAPPTRNEGVLSAPGLTVGYLAFQTEKGPSIRPSWGSPWVARRSRCSPSCRRGSGPAGKDSRSSAARGNGRRRSWPRATGRPGTRPRCSGRATCPRSTSTRWPKP
jgi:ABC-type transport system substrate-binding protein